LLGTTWLRTARSGDDVATRPFVLGAAAIRLGLTHPKSWEKGYITKGAQDTRWCHYQTLASTQKGEEPAPGDENDRSSKFGIS
jgi:hypothetical protein